MNMMMRTILGAALFCSITGYTEQKEASDLSRIEESAKKWTLLRKTSNGSYSYKKTFSSFVGFGHETVVVVKNNKVVERRYREWNRQDGEFEGESWTEKEGQIGSHKKGAKAQLLDDLYQEARTVAAKKLSAHEKRYVRFDKQGLLNLCFYVDTRIMDDAPRMGVSIHSIKLGTDSPDNL